MFVLRSPDHSRPATVVLEETHWKYRGRIRIRISTVEMVGTQKDTKTIKGMNDDEKINNVNNMGMRITSDFDYLRKLILQK